MNATTRSDVRWRPAPASSMRALLAATVVLIACGSGGNAPAEPGRATLRLPVRVHVISSRIAPFDGGLSDAGVATLLARASEIWGAADIVWEVESVVREPAEQEDALEDALSGMTPLTSQLLASVFPRGQLSGAWDVFIVRDLAAVGAPGIFFPAVPMVVSSEVDPAGLNDPGRILAHELGHSLTLEHVPCTPAGNLMAPGCASADRTRLDTSQIERARARAASGMPTRS